MNIVENRSSRDLTGFRTQDFSQPNRSTRHAICLILRQIIWPLVNRVACYTQRLGQTLWIVKERYRFRFSHTLSVSMFTIHCQHAYRLGK